MGSADPPDAFEQTFLAIAAARAVIAAARLGLAAELDREPRDARSLAQALDLDAAGVEALLTALESLGYLQLDGEGRYHACPAAAQLIDGEQGSIVHFAGEYSAQAWRMLGELEQLLRDPSGARSHGRSAEDPFWESYIRGLFELSRGLFDGYAELVPLSRPRALLDLAGGHGGFAMAMCRRFQTLDATVLDLPASARVGRKIVAAEGLGERVRFREGDALRDPLGDSLDVISIFNLLHHLTPEQARGLLARVHAALAEGGCAVVGETERPEPGRPANREGALSALVYFASSGTRNYSRRELTGWLTDAGFASVSVHSAEQAPWRLLYVAETG